MTEIRIGVDTGGTFTDFVIALNGVLEVHKIPSTPDDPSRAILDGIQKYLEICPSPFIIHGTTVATNTLLERKGERIALITTKGFEDVLFIGRQIRKDLYSLKGEDRRPLLPQGLCFGLEEHTTAAGKVEKKISDLEFQTILNAIKTKHVKAVAVSFINSYANPTNEKCIRQKLEAAHIPYSLSSEILPEHREYERTVVAAVNAYLMSVISQYLENLEHTLQNVNLRIMQSNEGYISPEVAKAEPIRTALSGPAGGVVGAFHLGKSIGLKRMISFDMGGTSSDVCLIDGKIQRTNESKIGDFPVRLPIIDIHTVGAGGGSIAYVDSGGSLRVGPESAGANPGPACYGKGNLPTVTDANLVLGRLVPEFFLGGKMRIYPERSHRVVKNLAATIDKTPLETASGIIQIANANMEKAIRVISIERGYDPREFALISFGGAGGMHAIDIAANLNLATIIVPKNAGVLSALGLLMADSIKDYSRSILKTAENTTQGEIEKHLFELQEKSARDMKKEGFQQEDIQIAPFLDLRYLGQSYEITLPYQLDKAGRHSFIPAFHKAHQRLYSYHHAERPVEIVNIRLKSIGVAKKIKLKKQRLQQQTPPKQALLKRQPLYYRGKKHQASAYSREHLEPGNRISGPALVVAQESTTFLPPLCSLKVDGLLNLIMGKTVKSDAKP
ncbi:MAG: hydantoinase/oxoprolinase family protein [Candidatus Aminicenantes bacterium]|nr:MAG: hydantoinase/oxoprolinase family protein [Candidatus Aminicenantes bacterium]